MSRYDLRSLHVRDFCEQMARCKLLSAHQTIVQSRDYIYYAKYILNLAGELRFERGVIGWKSDDTG